jgi:quercetin dioxygenase-like cupin family protein
MAVLCPSMQKEIIFRNAAPFAGYEIPRDEGPWIPGEPGILNQFLLIDLKQNAFSTLVKCEPGSHIALHFHTTTVVGYTLQGTWKYREHDWIARPGSFVYEPAGEAHTLDILGDETMISFFHVTGPHISLDENGKMSGYSDAFTVLDYCRSYCRENGIDSSYFDKITR